MLIFRRFFQYISVIHCQNTFASKHEKDTIQYPSCQRRPINLSSGCWHGDCWTELGWMARRAMRGLSRILHETVTGEIGGSYGTHGTHSSGKGTRGEETCSKVNCMQVCESTRQNGRKKEEKKGEREREGGEGERGTHTRARARCKQKRKKKDIDSLMIQLMMAPYLMRLLEFYLIVSF